MLNQKKLSREALDFQKKLSAQPELSAALTEIVDTLIQCAPFYECKLSEQQFDDVIRDQVTDDLELTLVEFADGIDDYAQQIAEDYCEI